MKNKKSTHSAHSSFWTGFSLGGILSLIILYAFGTKKGRSHLQTFMSLAENWEDHLVNITKEIETIVKNRKQEGNKENSSFVGELLNKIKSKSN